jgi:UDP-glucose 4-epimerase
VVVDKAARPKSFPHSRRLVYWEGNALKINSLLSESLRNLGIVHLAAETSVEDSVRRPLSSVRSNIEVTCAVLELARKLDSERFVLASTAAIYGDRRGHCKETDFPLPSSPYAASKLASEYYCKVYSKLYGIPTVILRYFNVYGPGQSSNYAGVITRFVSRGLKGKPPIIFGDGNQTRDFVYVGDVVRATLNALRSSLPGGTTLNIGTGRAISVKSLADKILRILKLEDIRPRYDSPRPGDVRNSEADPTLSRRMIDFQPSYELDQGLRATVKWLKTVLV